MKHRINLQSALILLLLGSFSFSGLTYAKVSKIEPPYNTQIESKEAAIPGPIGATGPQGKDGLSIIGPPGATSYNQVPVLVQGQKAAPCSVTTDETSTTIICPDGSTSTIKHPTDGQNGKDGSDGRGIEIRRNSQTGDIETKFDDDLAWKVLLTKCDYNPGSCNGS